MSDFYEWWDVLVKDMNEWHDTNCAGGDDATPCQGVDREQHVKAAYLTPHLRQMVHDSGIYKKEAN